VRVLIFGGGGMLGHKLWQACRDRFDTMVTLRGSSSDYPADLFDPARTIENVDARDADAIVAAFARARPAVVINCVGIVKQRPEAKDPIASIAVNAMLPHRLAAAADAAGARLIHISTDCVYSGRKGGYRENEPPDAEDLYGRSKLLGEVDAPHLTLRTSLIGRELRGSSGLVEWFLGRQGKDVEGYRHAVFSGLTTLQLSRHLAWLIESGAALSGLYHVAAEPISKHDLLCLLNAAFDAHARVVPADTVRIDRSLDGRRFTKATGLGAPPWPTMIAELAADAAAYGRWRRA
jgi:dTDP-4-dehydrorhamnose reductase